MDRFARFAFNLFQRIWAQRSQPFGILVIGETGSGKSTLINNILGENVAKVGESTHSETAELTCHEGKVQEIPVKIYDTPGLGDSADDPQLEESHLKNMKAVMDSGEIALVIICFKMTETRMSSGNIRTFKTYHNRLHLNWKKVIIALTYADVVPAFKRDEPPAEVYQRKLKQWKDHIGEVLREKVGVAIHDKDLRIHPVTKKYTMKLSNGKEWFIQLWLSVMEVLNPRRMLSYLKMHIRNINMSDTPPTDEDKREMEEMMDRLQQQQETVIPNQQLPIDRQTPAVQQPLYSFKSLNRPTTASRWVSLSSPITPSRPIKTGSSTTPSTWERSSRSTTPSTWERSSRSTTPSTWERPSRSTTPSRWERPSSPTLPSRSTTTGSSTTSGRSTTPSTWERSSRSTTPSTWERPSRSTTPSRWERPSSPTLPSRSTNTSRSTTPSTSTTPGTSTNTGSITIIVHDQRTIVQQLSVHHHNLVVTPARRSDTEPHPRPNINIDGGENKTTFFDILLTGIKAVGWLLPGVAEMVVKGLEWGWNIFKGLFS